MRERQLTSKLALPLHVLPTASVATTTSGMVVLSGHCGLIARAPAPKVCSWLPEAIRGSNCGSPTTLAQGLFVVIETFTAFASALVPTLTPLRKYGIYGPTDFSRFNLINFNVPLKNSSIEYFEKSTAKMYSQNTPSLEDINNKLYLNIFKIKYLLISSKEYYEIKSKDLFLIIDKFYLNDREYFILKNQNNHLSTIVTDYQINQINKLSECQIDLRKCIKKINELNLYSYANNIEIKRQGLNKYNITSKLSKDINLVIPFTFNKNWNSKNNVERLGKYLQTIKAKSSQLVLFEYFDLTRFILKCISILSFIILSITLVKLKLKKLHL